MSAVKVYLAASPGTNVLGSATLVMATSALVSTVTLAEATLLSKSGSGVGDETSAVLEMLVPSGVDGLTLATIVIVAVAPAARVPSWHMTVAASWVHVPELGVADTKVTSGGSGSVTAAARASEGPSFPPQWCT